MVKYFSGFYEGVSDSRIVPFGVVLLSIIFIVSSAIPFSASIGCHSKQDAKPDLPSNGAQFTDTFRTSSQGIRARLDIRSRALGGKTRLGFTIACLMANISLLCISVINLWQEKMEHHHRGWTFVFEYPESYMTITFLYTSILATVSLACSAWSQLTTRHLNAISLFAIAVYAYRDLWPLATYRQLPVDFAEGKLLWIKIAILAVNSIIIPLCMPRRYVPVDPKHPMPIPNPEQTASWLSRSTYMYIDPVVWLGYKVSHLRHDQLPPLSDNDYSQYQTNKASQYLDPLHPGRRYIFFGLMQHFRRDYAMMALSILVSSLCSFAAPTSINKILSYLEKGGKDTSVRPWLWIALLLLGPMLESTSVHWFMSLACRVRVRVEGLITQLVFEHSLRIRLNSDTPTEKPTSDVSAKKASQDSANQIGKIHNLVTSDLANILGGIDFLNFIIQIPLQITFSMVFLYQVLGLSAMVGLATTIIFIPVPGFIGSKVKDIQIVKMKQTDARVQAISEAVNVMRMIKLFGWENKMSERVQERRDKELYWIWKIMVLKFFSAVVGVLIPTLTMLTTYATYTVIMKEELNASKIFSTMVVFDILRTQIQRISWRVPLVVQAKVSLDRLDNFLTHTDLLDSFSTSKRRTADPTQLEDEQHGDPRIGFKDVAFSWTCDTGPLATSSRQFRLRIDGELVFKQNCVNLIIGPTGSGKTSMLMALLSEMHYEPLAPDSWFNLPRENGIAYAAQESWVQNATIKDNILFGALYDEKRYRKVVHQCALEQDILGFEAGDNTEVGERGLTLSGGQKARLTLARAIYSPARIILLDDVLASLDVHTSAWIVDKCFRGELIKGRTVLVVTHNISLVAPIADFIVSIGLDGSVQTQGAEVEIALARDPVLASEAEVEKKESQGASSDIPYPITQISGDGKLVVAEEIVEGHVTLKSLKLFLAALGGHHPTLFFASWILAVTLSRCVSILGVWFLGVWGSQYESCAPSEIPLHYYLAVFTSILAAGILVSTATNVFYNLRVMKAVRIIHSKLMDSIFAATLRWLDETPTARIISRCTQDIRSVDGPIPQSLSEAVNESITVLTKLGAIVLFTPLFIIPGSLVAAAGTFLGSLYLRSQLSCKREMSNGRSPLLAHFNAAIHGLVSIRAFGAQTAFKEESFKRIDFYSRTARTAWNLNRWIGLRIDFLGALFVATLASCLVYGQSISAAKSGFSLNMALEFCTYLFYLIRTINDLEVECNSLERIQGYIDIEHEPEPVNNGKPPAAWPTSGDLRVENLSARYSKSGPKVLHDISFHIKSGERVGVVGRTGSGKSSLALALLRCILTEGCVYFDEMDTKSVNLDALRSNITIIPQTPELLRGTLRQNLDPFDQHDDTTLNNALHSTGFFSLREREGWNETRITLDTNIAGAGSNLSVGERQIIALARAIVRGSKLLILDEATSAIDYKTDALVQASLRQQAHSNVTVITIAHRLQTIMDADKIIVLDSGRIIESGSPISLLYKENGMFKTLVDGSADRVALFSLVK